MIKALSLWTGDYGRNCFQSGDKARYNPENMFAHTKAQLEDVINLCLSFVVQQGTPLSIVAYCSVVA